MKRLLLILCLTACSGQPSREEQSWVADLESKVILPKGAGTLACYERHYAILQGQELAEWGLNKPGRKLLIGHYLPEKHPGTFWHGKAKDLPKVYDAGCEMIEVIHLIGERDQPIRAFCSPTIAGHSPETVDPPRNC